MSCIKKGYKVFDFLNKTWVSIIIFEIIFVVQDPLLTKDYFWIGIAAIFTPDIYKFIIPYLVKEKSMFLSFVILLICLVGILFINKPIHADPKRLGVILWTLSFNFMFLLLLKIIFTEISNWIKETKSKHWQLIILIFIYFVCLLIAWYHIDIISIISKAV